MFDSTARLLCLGLFAALSATAQDLHFKTTAPAWTDGAHSNSYSQIGSPAVDVQVNVASTGGSTTFTLGTPKGVSTGLQLAVNFSTTADTKVITITFAQGVPGLSFSILGIDKNASSQDKVTIEGSINNKNSAPTLSPSAYVTQSGNTLTGSADDPGSAASGVTFGGYVDKVTITFGCGPASPANPGTQGITIGHLNWSGPLPVELVSFMAKPQGRAIQLSWTTAWERNAGQFIVERSHDLTTFGTLANRLARGNTDQQQIYEFADEWPLDGPNYYRLKQVDNDGRVAYSKIIAASSNEQTPMLELLGNPVESREIVVYTRNMTGSRYRLLTSMGYEIPVEMAATGDGTTRLLPARSLSPGTYWLWADTADQRLVKAVLIR